MRRSRRALLGSAGTLGVLIGLGALQGCAIPPARPASDRLDAAATRLAGRLSLQVSDASRQGFSADFELSGSAREGELLLTGPLGASLARAVWSPAGALLYSAQAEPLRAHSLDALAEAAFGEPLPLAALFDWLAGRPWPQAASEPRAPDAGAGFRQLGWEVDLQRFAEGRITAIRAADAAGRPSVALRVRLAPD